MITWDSTERERERGGKKKIGLNFAVEMESIIVVGFRSKGFLLLFLPRIEKIALGDFFPAAVNPFYIHHSLPARLSGIVFSAEYIHTYIHVDGVELLKRQKAFLESFDQHLALTYLVFVCLYRNFSVCQRAKKPHHQIIIDNPVRPSQHARGARDMEGPAKYIRTDIHTHTLGLVDGTGYKKNTVHLVKGRIKRTLTRMERDKQQLYFVGSFHTKRF